MTPQERLDKIRAGLKEEEKTPAPASDTSAADRLAEVRKQIAEREEAAASKPKSDESPAEVLARIRAEKKAAEKVAEKAPMSAVDVAAGAAMDFTESSLAIGEESGAIGRMLGGSVYDILNTDKDLSKIFSDNFNWDRQIDAARGTLDRFEEEHPTASKIITGAGMVAGLGVPAATLGKASTAGKIIGGAAEGAVYGAAAGRELEGRATGAAIGAGVGGAIPAVAAPVIRKLSEVKADKMAKAEEEAEAAIAEVEQKVDNWEASGEDRDTFFKKALDDVGTGVSDSLQRRVSPEVGLRVQRADETALKINSKEAAEYLETKPMQAVIKFADENQEFKGMMLDFAAHANHTSKDIVDYVRKNLGDAEAEATAKYLRWSEESNKQYNKRLGDDAVSGVGYLHTKKEKFVPTEEGLKDGKASFAEDDIVLNPTKDKAELERTRGLYSKGELRPDEYANPFISNASRIQSNKRLLQLQEKFGIKDLDFGAPGLVDEIERAVNAKIKDPVKARQARNSIVSLLKGQNRVQNEWMQAYQNTVYAGTLAGPKSSVLNLHDMPVAGFNHGVANMMKAFTKEGRMAADLDRLGIRRQTMGEFASELKRNMTGGKTKGQKAAALTGGITQGLFKLTGFQGMDRLGKRGVVGTVASRLINESKDGKLTGSFAQAFDGKEQARLMRALNESGGDINKMSQKDLALYDEALTLGLGQQQLISAAGRPEKWLDHPIIRPLYMMRGFAIKQNFMLSEKIVKNLKEGNVAEAAKQTAKWIALPGTSYAALNVGRNEVAGNEDYEASAEEFAWSMMDSLLGPASFNTLGVGSQYQRNENMQTLREGEYVEHMVKALAPPGGMTKEVASAVNKAIMDKDPEALMGAITELPAYKQFKQMMD